MRAGDLSSRTQRGKHTRLRNMTPTRHWQLAPTQFLVVSSAQVAFFRWEDIPWDSLAFPTTSWALWHHGQRYEHSRSELLRSESSRSGHFSGLLQSGVSPSQGGESVGADSSSIVAGDIKQGSGGGGSVRSNSGLGGGRCPGSTGAVFSNPATNTAHFWCPKRGLHAKDDWNLSADS